MFRSGGSVATLVTAFLEALYCAKLFLMTDTAVVIVAMRSLLSWLAKVRVASSMDCKFFNSSSIQLGF